jgi:hypothetical protein
MRACADIIPVAPPSSSVLEVLDTARVSLAKHPLRQRGFEDAAELVFHWHLSGYAALLSYVTPSVSLSKAA